MQARISSEQSLTKHAQPKFQPEIVVGLAGGNFQQLVELVARNFPIRTFKHILGQADGGQMPYPARL